jgi:REP element-mobilizing transposase RayT
MKFRDYEIFRTGCYYHVYNRGNNRQILFHDDADYSQMLKRLKIILGLSQASIFSEKDSRHRPLTLTALPKNSFTIVAYCLMPNHFHLLVRQNTELRVDRLITKLCTSYAAYYNRKYEHVGHVFQDAFKAKLVDSESYLTYLSAYIHNNPADIQNHLYSSFLDYTANRGGIICDQEILLSYFNNNPDQYRDFVLGYNKNQESTISHLLFDE